jgi:G:T/U-mismatch repair DNA glycosylase
MHGQSSNSSSGSSSSSSGSNNTNNFKVLQPRGIINERMTLVKWEEVSNASSYSLEVKKGNTVFYTENNMSRPSAIIKRHLLATPEDYVINVTANMPNGTKIKSESQKFNYFAGGKYEDFFLEDGSPRIKPKILLPVQIGALDNHANFKWTPVKDAASYIYRVVEYKTTYTNTWDSKPRSNTTYLETQHLGRRKNKYVIIIALDENKREMSGSLQYPLYQKDAQSHSQNGQSSQNSSSVSNSNASGSSSSANSSSSSSGSSSSGASSSGASNSGTSNSNSSAASNSNSGSGNSNNNASTIATITSPARSVTSNNVTFRWRVVTGARTYLLWVDNLTTGEKRKIYLPNLTSTQHTQTLSNGRYRMWVRPNNSSRWESPYEFTVASTSSSNAQTIASSSSGSTNSNTSSMATITSPASRVTSNNVTFRWTPVTNASQYELWVDNITTGVKKIIHKTNLRTTQHTQSLSNGNYKMWVRANNSRWTRAYSFTVASTNSNSYQSTARTSSSNSRNSNSNASTKAIITSPASNRLTDNAVTFEWTPVHNALEYELLVENLTTRVYAFINLKGLKDTKYTQYINNGRYRMWVRSNNSSWSNSFTFTVANGRF